MKNQLLSDKLNFKKKDQTSQKKLNRILKTTKSLFQGIKKLPKQPEFERLRFQ